MNNTFCVYPWMSMTFLPKGKTKLCGANQSSAVNENDKVNSQLLKEARLKMLKGEKVKGCEFCYVRETNDYWSAKRTEGLRIFSKWTDEIKANTKEDGTSTFKPFYIDYREDDVEKLANVISSLPHMHLLKLYKIDYSKNWTPAFSQIKNQMRTLYCCGQTDKLRFDKEFLDVPATRRRVSVIHNLYKNTTTETIEKIKYLQTVLTKSEDEIQLYINLDNDIPNNFLETFKIFDKAFPDIRLRIYPDSIKTFGGDPIEYWNKETAVMRKMRDIVNSTANYDIKALYKELCQKFTNYQ